MQTLAEEGVRRGWMSRSLGGGAGLSLFAQMPTAVLASLVAALIASAGLAASVLRGGWAVRNSAYFTAFAAGVLVTTALTLLPEASAATRMAPFAALGGYLTLYAINLIFRQSSGAAIAPLVAIGLHSFLDGAQYGILFGHDAYLGLVASVGLIAHEFAEGIVLFAALRAAGLRMRGAAVGAFLGAAVTTPLGALASQPLLGTLHEGALGVVLGAAAGALLYVGATHLPTHLRGQSGWRIVLAYAFGVALSLSLALFHGALHDEGTHEGFRHADHAAHLRSET